MKPRSSIAREMSGWIASSPKRADGGARGNLSPVLIWMLTGETLAVNDFFQRKAIHSREDLLCVGTRPRPGLARCGVSKSDDRRDGRVRRYAELPSHAVLLVGTHRVGAAPDSERPCHDHHVLRDASGVETQPLVQKYDRDRDGAPIEIPRRHERAREIAPALRILEDDEAPGLGVLGASRRAPGREDLPQHVFGDGTVGILAHLALRHDREVTVHRAKYRGRRLVRRLPQQIV